MVATRRGSRVCSPPKSTSDEASDISATPSTGRRTRRTTTRPEPLVQCTRIDEPGCQSGDGDANPSMSRPVSPQSSVGSAGKRCFKASRFHSGRDSTPSTPVDSTHEADVSDLESCCSALSDLEPPNKRHVRNRRTRPAAGKELVSAAVCGSPAILEFKSRATRSARKGVLGKGSGDAGSAVSEAESCSSAVSQSQRKDRTSSRLSVKQQKQQLLEEAIVSEAESCTSSVTGARPSTARVTRARSGRTARLQPIPIHLDEASEGSQSPVLGRGARGKSPATPAAVELQSADAEGFGSGPSVTPRRSTRRRTQPRRHWAGTDSESDLMDTKGQSTPASSRTGSSSSSSSSRAVPVTRPAARTLLVVMEKCTPRPEEMGDGGAVETGHEVGVASESKWAEEEEEEEKKKVEEEEEEESVLEDSKFDVTVGGAADWEEEEEDLTLTLEEDDVSESDGKPAPEGMMEEGAGGAGSTGSVAVTTVEEEAARHTGPLPAGSICEALSPDTDVAETMEQEVAVVLNDDQVVDVLQGEEQISVGPVVSPVGPVSVSGSSAEPKPVSVCRSVEAEEPVSVPMSGSSFELEPEPMSVCGSTVEAEAEPVSVCSTVEAEAEPVSVCGSVEAEPVTVSSSSVEAATLCDSSETSVATEPAVNTADHQRELCLQAAEGKDSSRIQETEAELSSSDQTASVIVQEEEEEAGDEEHEVMEVDVELVSDHHIPLTVSRESDPDMDEEADPRPGPEKEEEEEEEDASGSPEPEEPIQTREEEAREEGALVTAGPSVDAPAASGSERTEGEARESAVTKKSREISLLDSSEDETDGEEEEEEDDEEKEEDEEEDVECIGEKQAGPSQPDVTAPSLAVGGLFTIDTKPGLRPGEKYYKEKRKRTRRRIAKINLVDQEEFVDEEGDEEDDDTLALFGRPNPRLGEMSSRIDPDLNLKKLGGLYINFQGGLNKPVSNSLKKLKQQKLQDKLMKKSVIGPDFEKKEAAPPYKESKRAMKLKRKEERDKTTGDSWFNMKAPELTEELKGDLKTLKMRAAMDPKRFYKKDDRDGFPKYFQMGTVVDNPLDFYHSRLPKKQRKRTMVEELLADAEYRHNNKKKYQQIMTEKAAQGAGKKHKKRSTFSKK